MRNVLTKIPESAGIWKIVFDRLNDEEGRRKIVAALLGEIGLNSDFRARLAGLLTDQSEVGKLANKLQASSPEEIAAHLQAISRSLSVIVPQKPKNEPQA